MNVEVAMVAFYVISVGCGFQGLLILF